MRGISSGIFVFTAVIFLIEIIAYWGIRQLIRERTISVLYWSITLVFLIFWLTAFLNPEKIRHTSDYRFFYFVIFISVLNLLPKGLFSVFVVLALPLHLLKNARQSLVLLLSGLILSLGMLLTIGYGILIGKKTIRMERVRLSIASLPEKLEGLKIIQISDLHLAGFEDDRFLKRCVDKINKEKPDLILFTGDMVNNFHQEIDGFEAQLKRLNPRLGKFAILGNHDYGTYTDWNSWQEKELNLALIKKKIRDCGFRLLLNESVRVSVNDTALYILGVQNWGHPPYPQFGRLDSALLHVPEKSFRILITHDPTHWNEQVVSKTDIPLSLAGHTHGGQLSLKIAGIEFSPIWFRERHWGGLYRQKNQFLYVNRGLGCVGLAARIDMNPEITIIILKNQKL